MPSGWSREIFGYRIAILAAILGGVRILFGAIESLLAGKVGADLALGIATIAAMLLGEPLVAAEIVFIGMLGECLESITFERTQRAVRKLVEVFPRRCWALRDGQEIAVVFDYQYQGQHVSSITWSFQRSRRMRPSGRRPMARWATVEPTIPASSAMP